MHHAQIDRLWWHWQQIQPAERLTDYSGPTNSSGTASQAALEDILQTLGLAEDITVLDIMTTESDLLCYKY